MRILVISNYYPPHVVGGYEQACAETVKWLQARGHEIRVLTGQSPAEADGVFRELTYIDYQTPGYRQKWQVERGNYACTQQHLQDFQPDLVYLWSQRLVSLAPAQAVQSWGGPRVFEMGDFWPDSYFKSGWKQKLRQQLKACLPGMRQAQLDFGPMIAVARWMLPELSQKYQPLRTYHVPNAIVPLPSPGVRARNFNGPLRALFAGRLVPEKGLHLALEALAQLKRAGVILPLSIAGKGDSAYLDHCQRQAAAAGLDEQLSWLGWQDEMAALYASHDLLLMPTLMREPFGLVILQAMQAGMLVWASDAYGPAEILRHGQTGFLFAPGDATALADSLLVFLSTPGVGKQISQRAQADVAVHYSLNQVKPQIEKILKAECELQKGQQLCLTR